MANRHRRYSWIISRAVVVVVEFNGLVLYFFFPPHFLFLYFFCVFHFVMNLIAAGSVFYILIIYFTARGHHFSIYISTVMKEWFAIVFFLLSLQLCGCVVFALDFACHFVVFILSIVRRIVERLCNYSNVFLFYFLYSFHLSASTSRSTNIEHKKKKKTKTNSECIWKIHIVKFT